MSGKALTWARKQQLKLSEKNLLVALASSFNEKKGYCFPNNKTLARWCSCSERTINRHIKSLVSKNLVQKEEMRNHLGYRIGTKYYLNFEQNTESLTDNLSGRDKQSLTDNLSIPNRQSVQPNRQSVGQDYIYKQNNKQKEKLKDFSLVYKSTEQTKQSEAEIKIIIGIQFEQLKKIFDDSYDIPNAQRLFKQICLEKKHPEEFAKFLITERKYQKKDYDKIIKGGEFTAAPCSLSKWLTDERWTDKIKPIGFKKKVSPYVKCGSCGEEYLKGSYCGRCAELRKPRTMRMERMIIA